MKIEQSLYPIIRRVRRPLIPTDAGTTATVVVPAQPPAPVAPSEAPKIEPKRNATRPPADD